MWKYLYDFTSRDEYLIDEYLSDVNFFEMSNFDIISLKILINNLNIAYCSKLMYYNIV